MMQRAIISLFFLLAAFSSSYACQCEVIPALSKRAIEKYDVIFLGKVIAVSGKDDEALARFRIDELYKGEAYTEIEVRYDAESDCGMTFAPGEQWTIYAKWIEYGLPRTDFCMHSRREPLAGQQDYYEEARGSYTQELQWLRDSLGVKAFIDPEAKKDLGHKNQLPDPTQAIVYTLAGLVGLAAIFFFVHRMFKRDGK